MKFVKAEGEMDHTYAVDFQVYKDENSFVPYKLNLNPIYKMPLTL